MCQNNKYYFVLLGLTKPRTGPGSLCHVNVYVECIFTFCIQLIKISINSLLTKYNTFLIFFFRTTERSQRLLATIPMAFGRSPVQIPRFSFGNVSDPRFIEYTREYQYHYLITVCLFNFTRCYYSLNLSIDWCKSFVLTHNHTCYGMCK